MGQDYFDDLIRSDVEKDITTYYLDIANYLSSLNRETLLQLDYYDFILKLMDHIRDCKKIDYLLLMKIIKLTSINEQYILYKIKCSMNTSLITDYIRYNELSNSEFIKLVIGIIRMADLEDVDDLNNIEWLKNIAKEKSLFNEIRNKILCSGDIELIIYSSLVFDNSIIEEIFGCKEKMYSFLFYNSFTNEEETKYLIDYLIKLNGCDFQNEIDGNNDDILDIVEKKRIQSYSTNKYNNGCPISFEDIKNNKDDAVKEISEDNIGLEKLMYSCVELDLSTYASCGDDSPYISFNLHEKSLSTLARLCSNLANDKRISKSIIISIGVSDESYQCSIYLIESELLIDNITFFEIINEYLYKYREVIESDFHQFMSAYKLCQLIARYKLNCSVDILGNISQNVLTLFGDNREEIYSFVDTYLDGVSYSDNNIEEIISPKFYNIDDYSKLALATDKAIKMILTNK